MSDTTHHPAAPDAPAAADAPSPAAPLAPGRSFADAPLALKVVNLKKSYRVSGHREVDLKVLRGIDLEVHVGEWIALTGRSGSGKTTLLQLLGTLDSADSGQIFCFGEELNRLGFAGRSTFRRKTLGFIFQSYHLFPELNALENVSLAGRIGGLGTRASNERARDLLNRVGLSSRETHRPAELSGGEQQRVAIARSLMNRPRLILADEPTGNLDAGNSESIMQILQAIREEENLTIVMVTHDPRLSMLVDRAYHFEEGLLAQGGSLKREPEIEAASGGTA